MTNHIVLFEPLMPANTGNIARTCAGTNAVLHLIKPLGFTIDDKSVKRAGLDYWDKVEIVYHENLPEFLDTVPNKERLFVVSKFAPKSYSEANYVSDNNQEDNYLLFGKETTGLPEAFMKQYVDNAIRIPQNDQNIRALNLSNSVAIVIYEVLRQQQFPNLEMSHLYENDKLK